MSDAINTARRLDVSFQRYDAVAARRLAATIEHVYRESYVDAIASGKPFDSVEAFMKRFRAYTSHSDLDLVVAYHGREPVGQSWGWPLGQVSRWWDTVEPELDADFTHENGRRTFALSEIMVRHDWTGKGIAHALHDMLLSRRHEQRATLLVEPHNAAARQAYEHWGWAKIGQSRPGWEGAPVFDVMIRELGLTTNG